MNAKHYTSTVYQSNLEPQEWAFLGDFWRFEIGAGDSYTSVQWDQTNMSVFSVGEWRGIL